MKFQKRGLAQKTAVAVMNGLLMKHTRSVIRTLDQHDNKSKKSLESLKAFLQLLKGFIDIFQHHFNGLQPTTAQIPNVWLQRNDFFICAGSCLSD